MTKTYVTEVGEVTPSSKCRCGDAAELHEVIKGDVVQPDDTRQYGACSYYDRCTVQGCGCRCFEEAAE